MTCRDCTGHRPVQVDTFPAGDTRASLRAAHAAAQERERTTAPVHVHYSAGSDAFVVVRTERAK